MYSNNLYTERKTCIFCNTNLYNTFFEYDYKCPIAHYAVELENDLNTKNMSINISKQSNEFEVLTCKSNITENVRNEIPFNIYVCSNCNTIQTKYLGDLNEIYKINHADSTGSIMTNLHNTINDIIFNYSSKIKNIIEIGSSYGVLADIIIKRFNEENIKLEYNVIEPDFKGNTENKNIFNDFYENIDDKNIDANFIIISHVFEHFYNPVEILEKISQNKKIKYFLLIFPDLEYYLKNNILHVLNTEHTYYIDNDFLINNIKKYGFKLILRNNYENHSVILLFEYDLLNHEKILDSPINNNLNLTNYNNLSLLNNYFDNIFKKIEFVNKIIVEKNMQKSIYLWPASIHSFYLCIFGLNMSFSGFLDNSKNKIGKKVYGLNKNIFDFKKIIELNDENTIIIINGGIFNNEIKSLVDNSPKINFYYTD